MKRPKLTKALSVLMVLCMVLSLLPVSVMATEEQDSSIGSAIEVGIVGSNDEKSEFYHTVSLDFTKDVSHRFCRGRYTYCVKYVHKDGDRTVSTDITTICVNNRAEVEVCH